jgi:cellulose binding protein with CBM2 domain
MAQHRKRPARGRQWRIRGPGSPASGPRETRVASAVRRVVVTPTFAAGLGVVVAALLAFQVGIPSFRVSVPRWTGQRCTNPACEHQPGRAGPATVQGGQALPAPAPAATQNPGPGSADAASQPSAQPVVSYQTDRSWRGGFRGHLTFSFAGRAAPGHWWLRFTYPSGRIQRVWGTVRWQPRGHHIAVVGAPRSARAVQRSIQVSFQVTGHASRPASCSFNHLACHFRQ